MKWRCNIILAIMLGFTQVSGAWTRLTPEQRHFISIDGSVGYASLVNDSTVLKPGSGVAANLGVGYRLLYNDFLFSTGVEGYYMLNAQSMSNVQLGIEEPDDEGDIYRLTVDASNGSDLTQTVSLNVPILFGGEFRRLYFLVGSKLSFNLWGQAKTEAFLSESAVYVEYEGIIADVKDRFENSKISKTAPVKWEMDVLAHAEIGYRLGDVVFKTGADIPKPKQRYYLSLYVDYGLLNIRSKSSRTSDRLYYTGSGFDKEYFLTPAIMSSALGSPKVAIHQYSFGIKATILFEMPQKKPCVFCKDNNKLPTKRLQGLHVKKD